MFIMSYIILLLTLSLLPHKLWAQGSEADREICKEIETVNTLPEPVDTTIKTVSQV